MGKTDRFHPLKEASEPDHIRTPGERDRDRLLYTSAFRRLAGVTQVVGPIEGHVFHNRLTHTIEVAELARRLTLRLQRTNADLLSRYGGIDAEMAEAAAVAHNLGHPPFGHIGEEVLSEEVKRKLVTDGFEGNAQSFRLITRLSAHRRNYPGLNLTRGTLNSVLKYPWLQGQGPRGKDPRKFGAYESERPYFEFARGESKEQRRSLEAEIMDYADGAAYSVHDLEDFYRAGLIPLESLRDRGHFDAVIRRFRGAGRCDPDALDGQVETLYAMIQSLPVGEKYTGEFEERAVLRTFSAVLISRLVKAVALEERNGELAFVVDSGAQVLMTFLQSMVWWHVIENPSLATQQYGQRRIVRELFEVFHDAIWRLDKTLLPVSFHDIYDDIRKPRADDPTPLEHRATRLAADVVASLTDQQAVQLHRRLTGYDSGSVRDRI